jgi:hypothetical protein
VSYLPSDKAYYERNKARLNAARAARAAKQRAERPTRESTAVPKSEQVTRRYKHNIVEDMEYSDEEREFFVAVDRFKLEANDQFPTCRDLLRIIKQLGYRKCP